MGDIVFWQEKAHCKRWKTIEATLRLQRDWVKNKGKEVKVYKDFIIAI